MLLLAFDTTAAACSVALVRDGVCVARVREIREQGQAEALIPMIERAMADAGVAYAALDRIAVTIGPGSFTGVRVGLSAARALALAAGKPAVGVSSLEVLAAAVPVAERKRCETIVAAIDTKRGDLYLQAFDTRDLASKSEPVALPASEVETWTGDRDIIVVGDAAVAAAKLVRRAILSVADPLPDVILLARLATTRDIEAAGPLPLYILPPRITLAPHGGRLRPAPDTEDGRLRP